MPKWYQSWDDTSVDSFGTPPEVLIKIKHDSPHMLVSTAIGVAARNPYVSVATLVVHGLYHFTEPYRTSSGVGGPTDPPISTALARSTSSTSNLAIQAKSAHGFRKTKGVSARGKCPKGHYWSYKKKKCVKSKYR
ncbi:MAG TPA: hypothetical protein EYN67_01515 [Flavobacteriales bacterium]|nr:hypothetical protein [Flavobacteriales bacterium]